MEVLGHAPPRAAGQSLGFGHRRGMDKGTCRIPFLPGARRVPHTALAAGFHVKAFILINKIPMAWENQEEKKKPQRLPSLTHNLHRHMMRFLGELSPPEAFPPHKTLVASWGTLEIKHFPSQLEHISLLGECRRGEALAGHERCCWHFGLAPRVLPCHSPAPPAPVLLCRATHSSSIPTLPGRPQPAPLCGGQTAPGGPAIV